MLFEVTGGTPPPTICHTRSMPQLLTGGLTDEGAYQLQFKIQLFTTPAELRVNRETPLLGSIIKPILWHSSWTSSSAQKVVVT